MKLYKPNSYLRAPARTRMKVVNGCGPAYFPVALRETLNKLFGRDVQECCGIHDWMYFEGSSIKDKLFADFIFGYNLVCTIIQKHSWTTPFRLSLALVYVSVVIAGGWPSFFNAKK